MTDPTTDTTRRRLTEIPDLAALLPDALITRTPGAQIRRPVPSSRPPVNLDVLLLDTRRRGDKTARMTHCDPEGVGILPYLDGWARDIEATALDQRPDLPDELPDPATLTGIIDWLLAELDYAATLPQWYEMSWGIQQLHRNLKRAVANVIDSETHVPCSWCGEGRLERVPGEKPLWECRACGHEVSVQAVTINQAAKIIGIPKDRLYRIVNRPALLREANIEGPRQILGDAGGRKVYDLNDLRRVVAEMKLRSA